MSRARGERRLFLLSSRPLIDKLPLWELFELPGRPHVVYQIRTYANAESPTDAAARAREDMPFLFRAFETHQVGPRRLDKMTHGQARTATIHEYLDWTVTAQAANEDDELVSQP